jgi:hypothetical protein
MKIVGSSTVPVEGESNSTGAECLKKARPFAPQASDESEIASKWQRMPLSFRVFVPNL